VPTAASLRLIDAHWAAILGCQVADLRSTHTHVVPHGTLAGYQGAMLLRRGEACIVSVPPAVLRTIQQKIAGSAADEVFTVAYVARLCGDAVERIIGPAWQGCADGSDFRPADTCGACLLQPANEHALRLLERACDPTEWEHSSIVWERPPIFGCFLGAELAAAGTLVRWGDGLLSVGIITHPAHRGQGYGRAVVSAMTAHGLAQGAILRYQTLQANLPSVAIARALGYQEYGQTLAVRLTRLDLG
jgi:GNAT superfamily N-acetyltransferase